MRITSLLKYSWTELIRSKKMSLFLVLNFSFGLIGFFLLQILQINLEAQLAQKAQALLGADLSINARRVLTKQETNQWESQLTDVEKKSHVTQLFSMLRTESESRLAQVIAVDDNYPLYGELKLSAEKLNSQKPMVWLDPELQQIFKFKNLDMVSIGEMKFFFAGVIEEDPTRLLRAAGFAPRVMIHQNYLEKAQLIKPGSTLTEFWNYKLSHQSDLAALKSKIEKQVTDPTIQIEIAAESAQDSNRVLKYFTDYLGLVALISLGLCFLSGRYLLQWNFLNKRKNFAILKILGLSELKILLVFLIENILICFLSCVLSVVLVIALLPGVQKIIQTQLGWALSVEMHPSSLFIIAVLGILGPLLMSVPQFLQILNLNPLELLGRVVTDRLKQWISWLWMGISLFLFWVISVWQSHSLKLASAFIGILILVVVLFYFFNRYLWIGLSRLLYQSNWSVKYALKGLVRRPESTSLVFTTLSLATLVLCLLPHVKNSILSEIKPNQASQIPQLFLFDIQPEQVNELQKTAQEQLQITLQMNPLVRARILKVNDEAYERAVVADAFTTREQEAEARFRNRGVNLTYRSSLNEAEVLVKGSFEGKALPQQLTLISLEEKYAERVGVKINDVMTFDIQGVEMKAKVSSLRKVRWTSFQPNFFILFPTGFLEESPQIFLTSIPKIAAVDSLEKVQKFQTSIAQNFKNVSLINVSQVVESSMVYIDQMAIALQVMAWLAVVVGVFIFIILLNTQISERLSEMNLLQILGAADREVFRILVVQFVILVVMSVLAGIGLSFVVAYVIMSMFFDIQTVYSLSSIFVLTCVLIPLLGGLIYLGLKPLKNLSPADLIRQS